MSDALPDRQIHKLQKLLRPPSRPVLPTPEESAGPLPQSRLGKYALQERLASRTFRAVQDGQTRPLALRLLGPIEDRALLERIGELLRPLANLAHPVFVPHFKLSQFQGIYFLVRPYVPGRPVDATALGPEQGLQVFYQVARALQYAHSRGVVHGGLRPRNIILDDSARPYLVDTGLRAVLQVLQGRDELPPDAAGDLADLGTFFLSLICGRTYSQMAAWDGIPPLRRIAPEVDDLLAAMADRIMGNEPFLSAEEMAEEAGRLYQLIPGEQIQESLLQAMERKNRRQPEAG